MQSRGLWEGSRLGRADGGLGRAAAWGGRQLEGGCGLGEAGVLGKGGGRAGRQARAGQRWQAGSRALGGCGGINPYTLMDKLGLARIDGFGPPERRRAAQLT